MTRIMYDGVTSSALPSGGDLYAGYVDGRYAWTKADWARWSGHRLVRIAVFPTTDDGQVWDCEPGNGVPEDGPGWVTMRRRAGADPSIYIGADWWPRLINAFHAAGVALPHIWVAHWGIDPIIPAGAIALQYINRPGYDVSVVADYWPGVDPAPAPKPPPPRPPAPPPPPPAPPKPKPYPFVEEDMLLVSVAGTPGPEVYLVSGPLVSHVATHADLTALQAVSIPTVTLSQDSFGNMQTAAAALKGALSGSLAVNGTLNVS